MSPHKIADWHQADIVAAVHKSGTSLRQLAIKNGYIPTVLSGVFVRPWPKAERLIADQIGVHPAVLWPTRYNSEGKPNRQLGRPRKSSSNDSKATNASNVKERQAA